MIAGGFFDHETPDGVTLEQRLAKVNYGFELAGENIAWGEGMLATPAQIVTAWMHSDGHRANILDPDFRQIGLGIVAGVPHPSSFGGATYVTDFGTRSAQPEPHPVTQSATLGGRHRATHNPVAHYAVARPHTRRHARKHTVRRHVAKRIQHHARHRPTRAAGTSRAR
jgi:hypothetical protein